MGLIVSVLAAVVAYFIVVALVNIFWVALLAALLVGLLLYYGDHNHRTRL